MDRLYASAQRAVERPQVTLPERVLDFLQGRFDTLVIDGRVSQHELADVFEISRTTGEHLGHDQVLHRQHWNFVSINAVMLDFVEKPLLEARTGEHEVQRETRCAMADRNHVTRCHEFCVGEPRLESGLAKPCDQVADRPTSEFDREIEISGRAWESVQVYGLRAEHVPANSDLAR